MNEATDSGLLGRIEDELRFITARGSVCLKIRLNEDTFKTLAAVLDPQRKGTKTRRLHGIPIEPDPDCVPTTIHFETRARETRA